jgi:hypothetical protein
VGGGGWPSLALYFGSSSGISDGTCEGLSVTSVPREDTPACTVTTVWGGRVGDKPTGRQFNVCYKSLDLKHDAILTAGPLESPPHTSAFLFTASLARGRPPARYGASIDAAEFPCGTYAVRAVSQDAAAECTADKWDDLESLGSATIALEDADDVLVVVYGESSDGTTGFAVACEGCAEAPDADGATRHHLGPLAITGIAVLAAVLLLCILAGLRTWSRHRAADADRAINDPVYAELPGTA